MILRKHTVPAVGEIFENGLRQDVADMTKLFRKILDEKCTVDYGVGTDGRPSESPTTNNPRSDGRLAAEEAKGKA